MKNRIRIYRNIKRNNSSSKLTTNKKLCKNKTEKKSIQKRSKKRSKSNKTMYKRDVINCDQDYISIFKSDKKTIKKVKNLTSIIICSQKTLTKMKNFRVNRSKNNYDKKMTFGNSIQTFSETENDIFTFKEDSNNELSEMFKSQFQSDTTISKRLNKKKPSKGTDNNDVLTYQKKLATSCYSCKIF